MTDYTKAMKAAAEEYARLVAQAHEQYGQEAEHPPTTPPPPTEVPPPDPDIPSPEEPDEQEFNSTAFYNSIRDSLFGGSLNQGQVDGINLIGKACHYLLTHNEHFIFQCAYVLATVYHETARTIQPIEEYGGSSTRYAPWYGRGYVQLTWEENYQKQQNKLGAVPAVVESGIPYQVHDNWDYALHPHTSALITVGGMRDGDFTGKKLDDYNGQSSNGVAEFDYVEARRIVNGTDRASEIAGYARSFEAALRDGMTPPADNDTYT